MKNELYKYFVITMVVIFCSQFKCGAQIVKKTLDSIFLKNITTILKDSISQEDFDSVDFSKYNILYNQKGKPEIVTFRFKNNFDPDSSLIVGTKDGILTGNWLKAKYTNANTGYIFTTSFDKKRKSSVWFKDGKNIRAVKIEDGVEKILFDYTRKQ